MGFRNSSFQSYDRRQSSREFDHKTRRTVSYPHKSPSSHKTLWYRRAFERSSIWGTLSKRRDHPRGLRTQCRRYILLNSAFSSFSFGYSLVPSFVLVYLWLSSLSSCHSHFRLLSSFLLLSTFSLSFPLPSPVGYGPEADAVNADNDSWVVSSFAFMLKFDPYSVIRTAQFPDESLDVRPVTISVFEV